MAKQFNTSSSNEESADIGLIGLAVMGANLVLNMADKGFRVAVYNRTADRTQSFMKNEVIGTDKEGRILPAYELKDFVARISKPRRVMMMVKAGAAVDSTIELLLPLLDKGDVIIDGGNSHYPDTERRCDYVAEQGLYYIGVGVSGGEEGARRGPSMMPGGHFEAWPLVKDIFTSICAHVGDEPCCAWVGKNGAGHFVKMVHNGIEYGDMQLICEAYHIMRDVFGMSQSQMADVFEQWNEGELSSYLIEITSHILRRNDDRPAAESNNDDALQRDLLPMILDAAGQKGTGKWTCEAAFDFGVPLTLISEAVFARSLSARRDERVTLSGIFKNRGIDSLNRTSDSAAYSYDDSDIEELRKALYAAKIISYAQGFALLTAAKERFGDINLGDIALMWRGGCIIRSAFLGKIKEAYDAQPDLPNLMMAKHFADTLRASDEAWRNTVIKGIRYGIPMPAFSAALSYFDGSCCDRLPANLLQAQRDYFGAHTYERVDEQRGRFFHTIW